MERRKNVAIWEALVDGDKRRLNDDGTLFLLQVFGVGLPPARRLKVRSPQQHGSTDIGFRYDEREMRLGFFFNALNTSAAVAKRDEIYSFWRSLADTPIQLRYTREDNSVRQIDCHVVGVVDMPWNPDENQNGLQNFVVQVEAANPLWYDPTAEVVSFTQDDNLDWWLALGTIDEANVQQHVEDPADSQAGTTPSIADGSPWTIYFRSSMGAPATDYAVEVTTAGVDEVLIYTDVSFNPDIFAAQYYYGEPSGAYVARHSKILSEISGAFDAWAIASGTVLSTYVDSTQIGSTVVAQTTGLSKSVTWRNGWVPDIDYGAIYKVALTETQRDSLVIAVDNDIAGTIAASKTITYTGSFLTYPIITITGPITDPVLTNVSTGEDLDFTGVTIAAGDTYTIDCRFGYKTVKNAAGVNKIADLTAGSDLATFHLGADPDVSGGANAFTLTGTATDANTTVTVTYNERFVGA